MNLRWKSHPNPSTTFWDNLRTNKRMSKYVNTWLCQDNKPNYVCMCIVNNDDYKHKDNDDCKSKDNDGVDGVVG